MRVLFVTHSFPRHEGDGAGEFILRLATALGAVGVRVDVLAPSAPGLAATAEIAGIRVTRFRYAPRTWETLAYAGTMAEQVAGSLKGKLALTGYLAGARQAVRRAMASDGPDLIHAHWWFPSGLAASLTPRTTPLVVTLHGSDVRLAMKSRLAPMAFRKVARRAAAVTAVSSWLATQAERLAPGLAVSVAPMPADISMFSGGGRPSRPTLLFVGRLNAQKGVADLLQALVNVRADVTLDVVGDGPDRSALEATARQLNLSSRIRWHGHLRQAEVAPLYTAAYATVIPSREEGLGLVAAEALLSETPVIAYRSGGLTDLIENGVTGTLVDPGSVAQLTDAINRLVGDSRGAEAMGQTGRERMLVRFAPATAAAAYVKLYQSAVAR